MLYCGESNVAPSKYSIMDNKNHFESKVSDFLEALRKAGYSESTIRQYKKTCRLFIVYMDINYIQDCNVESIDLFLKDYATRKNAVRYMEPIIDYCYSLIILRIELSKNQL